MKNKACLWVVEVSAHLAVMDKLESFLDETERNRAMRYRKKEDRSRFVTGRAALRIILGEHIGILPADIRFKYGVNQKPELLNDFVNQLHFNVSHSGDLVLIGISDQPIGVDVEWVNPEFEFFDVMQEYYSPAEINHIMEGNSRSLFFEYWTRKEAVAKAIGTGIGEVQSDKPNLIVESFVIKNEYQVSVAGYYNITSYKYLNL